MTRVSWGRFVGPWAHTSVQNAAELAPSVSVGQLEVLLYPLASPSGICLHFAPGGGRSTWLQDTSPLYPLGQGPHPGLGLKSKSGKRLAGSGLELEPCSAFGSPGEGVDLCFEDGGWGGDGCPVANPSLACLVPGVVPSRAWPPWGKGLSLNLAFQ